MSWPTSRSKEFHALTFDCKRIIEFVERNPTGISKRQLSDDHVARAEFLVRTGWLQNKYIGCRGDQHRYIRTDKQ